MGYFGNTVEFHLEECFCFSRFIKYFANEPSKLCMTMDESPFTIPHDNLLFTGRKFVFLEKFQCGLQRPYIFHVFLPQ
jgi:hypothetical protein